MNPRDPNLAKLEMIAHALGALREELIFVGGCAADAACLAMAGAAL